MAEPLEVRGRVGGARTIAWACTNGLIKDNHRTQPAAASESRAQGRERWGSAYRIEVDAGPGGRFRSTRSWA
jgi:hypothetical protein